MISSWSYVPRPNSNAHWKLFCFPYAGGSGSIYRAWPEALFPDVEVRAVELPGRGGRLREPLMRAIPPLVQAMAEGLRTEMTGHFIFFGHSMGAILAFELARYLRGRSLPMPEMLLVSGHAAPHRPDRREPWHTLPDQDLIRQIQALGGTPREVFSTPELMELLLPILRADLELNETYVYTEDLPLEVPFVVFGGAEDRYVSLDDLDAWSVLTSAGCERRMVAGDHFFIHSSEPQLLAEVRRSIALHSRRAEPTFEADISYPRKRR